MGRWRHSPDDVPSTLSTFAASPRRWTTATGRRGGGTTPRPARSSLVSPTGWPSSSATMTSRRIVAWRRSRPTDLAPRTTTWPPMHRWSATTDAAALLQRALEGRGHGPTVPRHAARVRGRPVAGLHAGSVGGTVDRLVGDGVTCIRWALQQRGRRALRLPEHARLGRTLHGPAARGHRAGCAVGRRRGCSLRRLRRDLAAHRPPRRDRLAEPTAPRHVNGYRPPETDVPLLADAVLVRGHITTIVACGDHTLFVAEAVGCGSGGGHVRISSRPAPGSRVERTCRRSHRRGPSRGAPSRLRRADP